MTASTAIRWSLMAVASLMLAGCSWFTWLPRVDSTPLLAFRPRSETEHASVQDQTRLFEEKGVEVFVADGAVHGASMLHAERSEGDVELTWKRLLAFLADPSSSPDS